MIKKLIVAGATVLCVGTAWGATKCVALNKTMVAIDTQVFNAGSAIFENGVTVDVMSACVRDVPIYYFDMQDEIDQSTINGGCWCKMIGPYAGGRWVFAEIYGRTTCSQYCSQTCVDLLTESAKYGGDDYRGALLFGQEVPQENKRMIPE